VSVEPFLRGERAVLLRYLEDIAAVAQRLTVPVSIHFDYFREDKEIFDLVMGYGERLKVRLHSTVPSAPMPDTIVYNLEDEVGQEAKNYPSAIVMTVIFGTSGNPFVPEVLCKVDQLKKINPDIFVTADGGVNEKTVAEVKKHPVDAVVVGSYAKKCWEAGELLEGLAKLIV
jgi:ribulose-phosphate 3-epimerase